MAGHGPEAGAVEVILAPEERTWQLHRSQLVFHATAIRGKAALYEDAWRQVVIEFVAARRGTSADDPVALAAGYVAIGGLLGAYEHWIAHPDEELTDVVGRFLDLVRPRGWDDDPTPGER